MTGTYRRPTEQNFLDFHTMGDMIAEEQINSEGGNRTTASITGSQQYAATSYTVSDILQGTLNFRDPSESLLVTNSVLTGHLRNLYSAGADGLALFSSSNPGQSMTPGATTGNGGAGVDPGIAFNSGGTVNQEWVESLPAQHSNGALLWSTKGKGSREMHLPTSANIQEDISQHKQLSGMPPEWQHPWNMDRVGGTVGGEAKIYYDVNDAQTVIGESAAANGQPGAFGILSPEEEQFYISMAWPYKGDPPSRFERAGRSDIAQKAKGLDKSLYKGLRIIVYCVQTQKACVCTPGDWGPHPYYSNGAVGRSSINGSYFGLSPDTHFALGSEGKMDFIVGIMPDTTPLGPFTPQTVQQGAGGPQGFTNGGTLAITPEFVNTADEMRFAGRRIIEHPNCLLDQSQPYNGSSVFLNGFIYDRRGTGIIPAKNPGESGRAFLMPSLMNWLWYCMEGGFIFGGFLGAYNHRNKTKGKGVSNHAKGGAIDIGRLGHVSYGQGITFSLWDLSKSRHVMEMLIDFMGTLPRNVRPEEIGGPFETAPGAPLRVYLDPGHIHFGFNENMCGQLIPALKPGQPDSGVRGIRGVS